MSSRSQVECLKFVIFGYIRGLENDSFSHSHHHFMPDVVKELIATYAKNCFTWYTKKHGKGYQFFENKPLQAEKIAMGNTLLASADSLSLDVSQKFEWEITIIETKPCAVREISLIFGFVEYPLENSISNWEKDFSTENHFGILIYFHPSYSCISEYDRDGYFTPIAKRNEKFSIKNGDRFCFRFDFEDKKASFGYNDKFIADIYNIPSKIIPVVSIHNPMVFACTKWHSFFYEDSNNENNLK